MKITLIGLLAIVLSTSILKAEDVPFAAEVFHFKGKVGLSTNGGDFGEVEKGDTIAKGDVIKTGDKSLVIIRFPDKSTMRVDPNSEIKFEQIVERIEKTSLGSTDILLKAGRAVIDVINKSKAPVFNVRTTKVAMGVRGTRFLAGIDPVSGNTELAVDRGEVEISQIDRPEIRDAVDAGQAIHLEKGKEFTQPQGYQWVKEFNFKADTQSLDFAKIAAVNEDKRREFRQKRKEWKRDPKRWQARKDKWKKLRSEYLERAKKLKAKRKEFRAKKQKFLERRKDLMAKRNDLIGKVKQMKTERRELQQEKRKLQDEARSLRTGRKDPRRMKKLQTQKNQLKAKAQRLKERKKEVLNEKKKLLDQKRKLIKEAQATKGEFRRLKKKASEDRERMRRMKKRMHKMKKRHHQQQQQQNSDGAGHGGNSTGG